MVRLPTPLGRTLRRTSRRLGRRPSDVVRMALESFLQEAPPAAGKPADRVEHLIGSLSSGVPDLAERHREYVWRRRSLSGELLLDTGALVSLLDRSQTHHEKCRRVFCDWTGPVLSTEAVLTEATHLLAGVQGGRAACVDFFLSGARFSFPRAGLVAARPEAARQVW